MFDRFVFAIVCEDEAWAVQAGAEMREANGAPFSDDQITELAYAAEEFGMAQEMISRTFDTLEELNRMLPSLIGLLMPMERLLGDVSTLSTKLDYITRAAARLQGFKLDWDGERGPAH